MSRFLRFFVLLVVLAPCSHAQSDPSAWVPFYEAEYDDLGDRIMRWGWLDETGAVAVEPHLEVALVEPLREERARVLGGEMALLGYPTTRYGFVDRDGRIVVDTTYTAAYAFSDGRARVWVEGEDEEEHLTGYIDSEGDLVIPAVYTASRDFGEGRAIVGKPEGGYVILDREGREVASLPDEVEPKWDAVFSDGLAPVGTGPWEARRYGYVDVSGALAIPLQFSEADPFSEGLAAVAFEEGGQTRWGYIDPEGQRVITLPVGVRRAEPFSEGRAVVAVEAPGQSTLYGYVDHTGAWVHEPTFLQATPYASARAVVLSEDTGTWQLLDEHGALVADTGFPGAVGCNSDWRSDSFEVAAFDGALARFREDDCGDVSELFPVGYLDRSGRVVWRAEE